MTKRQKIRSQISEKRNKIFQLEKEITELIKQDILVSDKQQRFTESEQGFTYCNRPNVEKKTVGVVHWKENYRDEDTGKFIEVERSKVVRVNGNWYLDGYEI